MNITSRAGSKEVLTDKMIVEEVRKGDNYVVWKSPKTTVHIIPDGKLIEMIKKAVEAERGRFLQAFELEMEQNQNDLPYYRYIARWKDELFITPTKTDKQ